MSPVRLGEKVGPRQLACSKSHTYDSGPGSFLWDALVCLLSTQERRILDQKAQEMRKLEKELAQAMEEVGSTPPYRVLRARFPEEGKIHALLKSESLAQSQDKVL